MWICSGEKRKWNNVRVLLQNTLQCSFCCRKSSSLPSQHSVLLPCMAFLGLVLDWTWEKVGAEQLTPVKPPTAPICFTPCVLQLASGSSNFQSSSHLYDLCSNNRTNPFTKCEQSPSSHLGTAVVYWVFFLTLMLHSWVSSVFCTKNYGTLQSPPNCFLAP